jgi:hypothetical protein
MQVNRIHQLIGMRISELSSLLLRSNNLVTKKYVPKLFPGGGKRNPFTTYYE